MLYDNECRAVKVQQFRKMSVYRDEDAKMDEHSVIQNREKVAFKMVLSCRA